MSDRKTGPSDFVLIVEGKAYMGEKTVYKAVNTQSSGCRLVADVNDFFSLSFRLLLFTIYIGLAFW